MVALSEPIGPASIGFPASAAASTSLSSSSASSSSSSSSASSSSSSSSASSSSLSSSSSSPSSANLHEGGTKGGDHDRPGLTCFFAGEATAIDNPATTHGAFLSGVREARNIGYCLLGSKQRCGEDRVVVSPSGGRIHAGGDTLCALCGGGAGGAPGGGGDVEKAGGDRGGGDSGGGSGGGHFLLGPLLGPFQQDRSVVWVHENCGAYSPRVDEEINPNGSSRFFGLVDTVTQSAKRKCRTCARTGASVQCVSCAHCYHVPCASAGGWDFARADQGKIFYCPRHR